jgi:hypothetical protein
MTHLATRSVYGDCTGASGDLTRAEIIENASGVLADFVFESLLNSGITYGRTIDNDVLHAIAHVVASAMVDQHNYTERLNGEGIVAAANAEAERVP